MKYALFGESTFSNALCAAAEHAGLDVQRCVWPAEARDAQLALVACEMPRLESVALDLAEMGVDVAVPGLIAAEDGLLIRLHAAFAAWGRKLAPLFPERYAPNQRDVARILKSRRLGRIGMVEYLNLWNKGGSALYPLAEALDAVSAWLGLPVRMQGFRAGADDTDVAVVNAEFACGALLNLQAAYSTAEQWKAAYEISGSEGNLAYDSASARSVRMNQMTELETRYPLLGTQLCPLAAMLRDLPGKLAAQEPGMSPDVLALSACIIRAFLKGGTENE